MAKMANSPRIKSPEGRASYAFVFTPRPDKDPTKAPRYSMSLLIPKDSPALPDFKAAAKAVGVAEFGASFVDMVKAGRLKWPFRDGDLEPDKGPEYKGHVFLNMRNDRKPTVLDRKCQEIIDPAEFGSGDYCFVTGQFFAYDKNGNKGVSFSLGNIQKVRNGERLDNTVDARTEFDALPGGDDPDTSSASSGGDFDDL
jgi:hypothetical protein